MKVHIALMHTLIVYIAMHFHIVYCIDAHMKMGMLHEDLHDESMQLINKWPW